MNQSLRWFLGTLCLVGVIFLWVIGSALIQRLYDEYERPILITYISTSTFMVYIPIYFTIQCIRGYFSPGAKSMSKSKSGKGMGNNNHITQERHFTTGIDNVLDISTSAAHTGLFYHAPLLPQTHIQSHNVTDSSLSSYSVPAHPVSSSSSSLPFCPQQHTLSSSYPSRFIHPHDDDDILIDSLVPSTSLVQPSYLSHLSKSQINSNLLHTESSHIPSIVHKADKRFIPSPSSSSSSWHLPASLSVRNKIATFTSSPLFSPQLSPLSSDIHYSIARDILYYTDRYIEQYPFQSFQDYVDEKQQQEEEPYSIFSLERLVRCCHRSKKASPTSSSISSPYSIQHDVADDNETGNMPSSLSYHHHYHHHNYYTIQSDQDNVTTMHSSYHNNYHNTASDGNKLNSSHPLPFTIPSQNTFPHLTSPITLASPPDAYEPMLHSMKTPSFMLRCCPLVSLCCTKGSTLLSNLTIPPSQNPKRQHSQSSSSSSQYTYLQLPSFSLSSTWWYNYRLSIVYAPMWIIMNTTFNLSLLWTTLTISTILSTTSSIFVLILSSYIFKIRLTLYAILAALCAIAGATFVTTLGSSAHHRDDNDNDGNDDNNTHSSFDKLLGALLAIFSALCYGVYSVSLQYLSRHEQYQDDYIDLRRWVTQDIINAYLSTNGLILRQHTTSNNINDDATTTTTTTSTTTTTNNSNTGDISSSTSHGHNNNNNHTNVLSNFPHHHLYRSQLLDELNTLDSSLYLSFYPSPLSSSSITSPPPPPPPPQTTTTNPTSSFSLSQPHNDDTSTIINQIHHSNTHTPIPLSSIVQSPISQSLLSEHSKLSSHIPPSANPSVSSSSLNNAISITTTNDDDDDDDSNTISINKHHNIPSSPSSSTSSVSSLQPLSASSSSSSSSPLPPININATDPILYTYIPPKSTTSLLFGAMGLTNLWLAWPLLILLHYTNISTLLLPPRDVILLLVINSLFGTSLSDILWANAVLLTSPLIVTIGITFTIPLAFIYDIYNKKEELNIYMICGSLFIISAVVLTVYNQYLYTIQNNVYRKGYIVKYINIHRYRALYGLHYNTHHGNNSNAINTHNEQSHL